MSLARARVLDVDTPDPAAQALIAFDDELSRLGEPSLEWLKRHESFAAQWAKCRNASVMLALAWRFAPSAEFLTAALKCAERALPARSTPEPALELALALFEPEEQARLADVVRSEVPAEALVFRTR